MNIAKERHMAIIGMLILSAFGAWADYADAQQRYWIAPPKVVYELAGSPLTEEQYVFGIKYAAWSLSQRLNVNITVLGAGTNGNGIIHHAWKPTLNMPGGDIFAHGVTNSTYYPSDNSMLKADISYNRDLVTAFDDHFARVMVHEMAHAMGFDGHSDDPNDVMFWSADEHSRYALTANDVMQFDNRYIKSICHAEMTPDLDVYVPAIGGYGVMLRRVDDTAWRIGYVHDSGYHCSGSITDAPAGAGYDYDVVIDEIRSFEQSYSNVRLKMVGDVLTLVE
jgi:hypothetical protein